MKNISESRLRQIVRRVILENNENNLFECMKGKVVGSGILTVEDILKLSSCATLKDNPTDEENAKACLTNIIKVASTKINLGNMTKVTDLIASLPECLEN
jgi:hypothetical protein